MKKFILSRSAIQSMCQSDEVILCFERLLSFLLDNRHTRVVPVIDMNKVLLGMLSDEAFSLRAGATTDQLRSRAERVFNFVHMFQFFFQAQPLDPETSRIDWVRLTQPDINDPDAIWVEVVDSRPSAVILTSRAFSTTSGRCVPICEITNRATQ